MKYLRDDVARLQQRLEDTTTANDDLYLHNLQLREKAAAREKELAESGEIVADWEAKYKKLDLQFQRAQQTLEQHRREEEEEGLLKEEEDVKKEKSPSSAQDPSPQPSVNGDDADSLNTFKRDNEQLRNNVQNLQAQLHHYNASFQNLVGERDTLAQQYQNHFTQMKTHAQELETKLKAEEKGKSELEEEMREKLAELDELRRELEEWKGKVVVDEREESSNVTPPKEENAASLLDASAANTEGQSLAESLAIIRQLQSEIEILGGENSRLALTLEEECVKSAQLTDRIRADENDAADRKRLLANVENDKQV